MFLNGFKHQDTEDVGKPGDLGTGSSRDKTASGFNRNKPDALKPAFILVA